MPKFQQRHYEAIADLIRGLEKSVGSYAYMNGTASSIRDVVNAFVRLFEADNPQFKPHLFKSRCLK